MSLLDDFNRRLSDRAKSDTPPDNTQPQKSLLQKVMDAKVPYVLNESVFSDWAVFHRPHQLHAISEIDAGHPRGQVVIPTGTGSKMAVEMSDDQLSGLGFSSTKRNSVVAKIEGKFTRTIKLMF